MQLVERCGCGNALFNEKKLGDIRINGLNEFQVSEAVNKDAERLMQQHLKLK